MAELSIFIDESGHFDSASTGYYVLSLVFHEQRHGISEQVALLEMALRDLGFPGGHVVNSGAAVRGEEGYRVMDIAVRKAVFTRFRGFARRASITYQHFVFRKKEYADNLKLVRKIVTKRFGS